MLSYHNKPYIKIGIIAQLEAHHEADQLVKGQYWEDGKGCAVGCTIHSSNHKLYESYFGIPEVIARLEDRIFEGLPNELAMTWPMRFMDAIPVGKDLTMVWPKFAVWLLGEELPKHTKSARSLDIISKVKDLYVRWYEGDKPEKRWLDVEAEDDAYAAADAAASAAADAYAADAYAADAAADAYTSAALAAAYIADAAASAALAAAYAADASAAADAYAAYAADASAAAAAAAAYAADASDARKSAYIRMSSTLISILAST